MERQALTTNLIDLWQKLLKTQVNAQDDFFQLGGDSLTAIRMIMEVQTIYQVELDVETFFEEPSIANLANAIMQKSPQGLTSPSGQGA